MKTMSNDKMIDKTKNINLRGYGEPIMGSLTHDQSGEEGISNIEPPIQPVVTIDDLESLAEQLLTNIRILKTYKYPLGIRRGVKPH